MKKLASSHGNQSLIHIPTPIIPDTTPAKAKSPERYNILTGQPIHGGDGSNYQRFRN